MNKTLTTTAKSKIFFNQNYAELFTCFFYKYRLICLFLFMAIDFI